MSERVKSRREEMDEWINERPPMNFNGPKLVVRDGKIVCNSTFVKVNEGDPNWTERHGRSVWLASGRRIW
jgi:hypothetical protein